MYGEAELVRVFWDIENMPIPAAIPPLSMCKAILEVARSLGKIVDRISVFCDPDGLPPDWKKAMLMTSIVIEAVRCDKLVSRREISNRALEHDILFWFLDQEKCRIDRSTSSAVIITSDNDFALLTAKLLNRRYNIVTILCKQVDNMELGQMSARKIYWEDIIASLQTSIHLNTNHKKQTIPDANHYSHNQYTLSQVSKNISAVPSYPHPIITLSNELTSIPKPISLEKNNIATDMKFNVSENNHIIISQPYQNDKSNTSNSNNNEDYVDVCDTHESNNKYNNDHIDIGSIKSSLTNLSIIERKISTDEDPLIEALQLILRTHAPANGNVFLPFSKLRKLVKDHLGYSNNVTFLNGCKTSTMELRWLQSLPFVEILQYTTARYREMDICDTSNITKTLHYDDDNNSNSIDDMNQKASIISAASFQEVPLNIIRSSCVISASNNCTDDMIGNTAVTIINPSNGTTISTIEYEIQLEVDTLAAIFIERIERRAKEGPCNVNVMEIISKGRSIEKKLNLSAKQITKPLLKRLKAHAQILIEKNELKWIDIK
jgi:hypothetical protein